MKKIFSVNRFPPLLAGVVLVATCLCYAKILNEHITTPDNDYTIHYYNRDDTETDWYTSDTDAQSIADHFDPDTGTGIHDAQDNLSFREPAGYRRDVKLVEEWDPGVGGSANWTRIRLPVALLNSLGHGGTVALGVCVHEAHHICQYEYIGPDSSYGKSTFGMLGFEGPATAMQDMLFTVNDTSTALGWTSLAWMDGYLDTGASGSNHDDYFWGNNGYESALFWKYLTEQFGSTRTEPEVGVDVIRRFYQLADANRLGISTTIQDVLDEKNRWSTTASDKGVDLKEVFQDFTIANWLRRYRSPQTWGSGYTFDLADPARFYYVDEDPATSSTALYSASSLSNERPSAANVHSLSPGSNTGEQTINLNKWAARYVQCNYTGLPTGSHGIAFWAETESGGRMWYSLFGMRQSQTIDLLEKGTVDPSTGNSFKYATMQSATDPYTMLVAVFNGETGPSQDGFTFLTVDADYNFGYFEPELDIVEPTQNYRAYVGDGADPERFLARLRVSSPDYLGLGSLTGLEAGEFDVFVGSSATAANQGDVIAASYVLGEYWLTVQAPVKVPTPVTASGLIVRLGGASDVEEAAVVYDYLEVDQVLVIDRSGSMSRSSGGVERIDGARAAAQLFVDTSGSDDQIGIVRFSGDEDESTEVGTNSFADAQVLYSLQQMSSQFERDLVNLMIDEGNPGGDLLDPDGWTSIGDGLFWGAKELVDNGKAESEKWIILLSDGHQNEPSTFDDQFGFLYGTGVRVETIALGPNVDKNHLESIANDTNGKYYEVEAAESSPRGGGAGTGNMILDLANTYLLSSERIHRRDRILEKTGSIGPNATVVYELDLAEGGLSDCIASVYANSTSADLEFDITMPSGVVVPLPDEGYTATNLDPSGNYWDPSYYTTYRLGSMGDGHWTLSVVNNSANAESYLLVLSGKNKQGVQSFLHFVQYHGDAAVYAEDGLYLRGLPMPISLVLTDGQGPVLGADVIAEVSHPARPLVTLRLRDNGSGHDGAANDGVYSGVFAATTEADSSGGAYPEDTPPNIGPSFHVRVSSSGKDNLLRDFQRVDNGSFHLYEVEQGLGGDSDGDGMPTRYEKLHAGLDETAHDAFGDLDGDGLVNIAEYQAGTDPGAVDTDGGGENDKSELDNGANPLDHSDDVFPPPLQARVLGLHPLDHTRPVDPASAYYPKPNQNILGFAVERGYEGMEIYSSLVSSNSFALVATVPVGSEGGIYTHSNLVNYTTYYYYIVPLGAGGRRGVPSHIFSATPRLDYTAPEGVLNINDGAAASIGPFVDLSIISVQDAVEMKIGNSSNLDAEPWQLFRRTVSGYRIPAPVDGQVSYVYALLRDAEGNENLISDGILLLRPSSAGTFRGKIAAPLSTSTAGVDIDFLGDDGSLYEHNAPSNGVFSIPLPPGTYDVTVELQGYTPVSFSDQVLLALATIDLGIIELEPLDSDGDSLFDVHELRDHLTDRNNADTDGDGLEDGSEINHTLTSATDETSVLQFSGLPGKSGENVSITWDSVEGVEYELSYREALTTGGWAHLATVTAGVGNQTTYIDTVPAGTPRRVYRVAVPVP